MKRYATIIGTGQYLPEIEVSNEAMAEQIENASPGLGQVIGKFQKSTCITRRWYAPRDWATSDLAVRAAEEALKAADIGPEQLDMILLGTDSPDYITPATSVVVQHKLGAVNAGTFDIGCACASFPTAVAAAAGLLEANPWMNYIVVIGAYMMSKLADPTDVTSFFYGDGAGAAVLGVDSKPGFITSAYLVAGGCGRGSCAGGRRGARGPGAVVYKDGSYIGCVSNDHGDIVIEVVIQFGVIVDVNMISPHKPQTYKHEAAKALFREYPLMVIKNQKAEVDAVSGATSSRTNYTKATQMALDIASGAYKGKVFYGLAKNPAQGHTLVAVTVEGKKVTKVEFITNKGDCDTLMLAKGPDYKSKPAKEFLDKFPELAVKAQTDLKKIDAISGATHSYHEYLYAYENALKQAGLL